VKKISTVAVKQSKNIAVNGSAAFPRGACAQRAFDRGESTERRSAGRENAGAGIQDGNWPMVSSIAHRHERTKRIQPLIQQQ
jgi:hypothetical protein